MKVAVLGYGTVGSGVVEVLEKNQETICKKAGEHLDIGYILDSREFKGDPLESKFVKSIEPILEDTEVKVIAEAMGGVDFPYTCVKAALVRGKSVVTSNKELVATHGPELLELASNNQCNFLFEASVGGGIPIIRPLSTALAGDEIYEITGILNGTTNFILTKMKDEARDFESVLKEAQALGYAERNPEADVEGHDACRKIAILSSLAFGEHVDYNEVLTKGIASITLEDIADAKSIGHTIKLVGTCKKQDEQVFVRVEPVMMDTTHPLSRVDDVFNAIMVRGNMVGEVMFYGRGAGKLPTASAMVADMIDASKHDHIHIKTFWNREKIALSNVEQMKVSYFIRTDGEHDLSKVLVEELFGEVEEVASPHGYAFITPHEKQCLLDAKLEAIRGCKIISKIRVER